MDKIDRLDRRIGELAAREEYCEKTKQLSCFLGIKTHTALAVVVETGDFKRCPSAEKYACYLGLGITKVGNSHVRRLLVEAAQNYSRGQVGYKSRELKARQSGNTPESIAYADKANERLRKKYYRLMLSHGKSGNVAKTAVARELSCFIWGMMSGKMS